MPARDTLEAYARLAVEVGANVGPGQYVEVNAFVEHAPLVRAVARAAYEAGARYVDVVYEDEYVRKTMIEQGSEDVLDWTPPWHLLRLREVEHGGASIIIRGHPDLTLFADVDGSRLGRARRTELTARWLRLVNQRLVN